MRRKNSVCALLVAISISAASAATATPSTGLGIPPSDLGSAQKHEESPSELDTNHPVQSDLCGRRGEGRHRRNQGPGCNGSKSEGCGKSEGRNGRETKYRINRRASSLSLLSRKGSRILGQRAAVIGGKEQLPVGVSIHTDTSPAAHRYRDQRDGFAVHRCALVR